MKLSKFLTPRNWCQNELALDSQNNEVSPNAPEAVSFCLYGAMEYLYPKHTKPGTMDYTQYRMVEQRIKNALPAKYEGEIADFNDSVSYGTVKRLLRKAKV